jgi:hypothetical protein
MIFILFFPTKKRKKERERKDFLWKIFNIDLFFIMNFGILDNPKPTHTT